MKKIILISFIAIGALSSCHRRLDGTSGPVTSEVRTTNTTFTAIHLQDNIDVYYTQDTVPSIKVEAGENVIGFIHTDIINGELVIFESSNDVVNTKQIKVFVSEAALNSVDMEGAGDFVGTGMTSTTFNLSMIGSGDASFNMIATTINTSQSGSGDLTITGTSINENVTMSGSGSLQARFMLANNVTITNTGSGNAVVHAIDILNATLTGSGDIGYYGTPTTVNTTDTGSGDIYDKN